MRKSILITGAAGFLSTSIIEILLSRADELEIESIIGLDNLLFKEEAVLPLLRHPKFELVIGDVRNKKLLIDLVKKSNVIFANAGLVGMPICKKFPQDAEDINYGHIKTVVDNINPDTKLLYACTNSIYGDAGGVVDEDSKKRCISIYSDTKFRGEQEILKANGTSLRLATLCSTSFRQRRDLLPNTLIWKSLTDGYVLLYESSFQRCYISCKDASLGFVHALENYDKFAGIPFNCGNSSLNASKKQLAEKIKEYIPNFVIKEDSYNKDVDARNYIVKNDRLEATGFKCQDGWDTIIPQTLKAYRVLLDIENWMLT